jgi:ABC-type Fe3+ transport system permease subunit
VGLVGVVVVVCGLVLAWEGVRRKFEKHLDLDRMSPTVRTAVEFLGVVGTSARGLVFALAGGFVIAAAVDYDPRKAGGLDRALRELADTSVGPWLLVLAAVGLMMFGVYGYAEAIWRRT